MAMKADNVNHVIALEKRHGKLYYLIICKIAFYIIVAYFIPITMLNFFLEGSHCQSHTTPV